MEDIREVLFEKIMNKKVHACIYADGDGILSGVSEMLRLAKEIGVTVHTVIQEGASVVSGEMIAEISGSPLRIVKAEDLLIGALSKTSGVATAAHTFVCAAGNNVRIVCGAYKKMPVQIKPFLRQAVRTGGAGNKITDKPMIYMDKNYIALLGGVSSSVNEAKRCGDRAVVVQLHNSASILEDAWAAAEGGASIIFVDTGMMEDVRKVVQAVKAEWEETIRQKNGSLPVIAYAGGVKIADVPLLVDMGVDVIDIGRGILDAPILDMRMDVVQTALNELNEDSISA